MDGRGTFFKNGIEVPNGKLFINGGAVQLITASGVALNGDVVITANEDINGYFVQGFTALGAPVDIGTAVVADNVLTVSPTAGGVATNKWYAIVWA